MVKQKNKIISPEDMKTSEIINNLSEDHSEEEFDELDKEFLDRYPFSYYLKSKFEEIEEQIKELNKLLRHYHKDDKLLIEL